MMEVILSFETPVLTKAIGHNIPEDGILHSHLCENFKHYTGMTFLRGFIICKDSIRHSSLEMEGEGVRPTFL
jgi:hypothetical protein